MAKRDKINGGIAEGDMETYKQLNKELTSFNSLSISTTLPSRFPREKDFANAQYSRAFLQ